MKSRTARKTKAQQIQVDRMYLMKYLKTKWPYGKVYLMSNISKKKLTLECPSCQTTIVYSTENEYRPFCSERCQVQDRANWATESYRIPEKAKVEEPKTGTLSTLDPTDDDDDLISH